MIPDASAAEDRRPPSDPGADTVPGWARWVEWLFAVALSVGVLGYAALPWVWAERSQRLQYYPDRVYTHAMPTYADDATTYWSWMRQARDGRFFFTDRHTPDEHPRNYVNLLFWSLGTVSRLTGVSVELVYSAARVALGAILCWVLYLLASRMFWRPGERMACFFMLLLAGGWEGPAGFMERNYGWSHASSPAWWTPEMSTFFSLMIFPHFLAGFIAMVAVILLMLGAWDPRVGSGAAARSSAAAGGVLLLLTFFHPYDTVNVMGAIWAAPVALGLLDRRWPWREWRATVIATAIWLPSLLYNLYIFLNNPAMRAWDLQNLMITPGPRRLAFSLGIGGVLSVVAAAGFTRLRREQAVMLAWLVSTLVIIHLPLRFQRRMMGGIQFPLAVLATAAIACVLLPLLFRWLLPLLSPRRRKSRAGEPRGSGAPVRVGEGTAAPRRAGAGPFGLGWGTLAAAAVIAPLQLATPYYLQDIEWAELRRLRYPAWLQVEQWTAIRALEDLGPAESVVLASYEIGNYVPPLSGQRCVIGHYALTVDALAKKAAVARFFAAGEEDDPWRLEFLRRWSVGYVVVTAYERELGEFDPAGRPWLEEVFAVGEDPERRAAIYAVRLDAAPDLPASSIPSP
jgi:hypothetical protein